MCLYRSCACVFGEEKMRTYLLCIFSDFFFYFRIYTTRVTLTRCVCARVCIRVYIIIIYGLGRGGLLEFSSRL